MMHSYIKNTLSVAVYILLLVLLVPGQARDLPDFTVLAEHNAPAVVNISTKQKPVDRLKQGFPFPDLNKLPKDNALREFLQRFFDEHGYQMPDDEPWVKKSLGSGFIISADGFILTNKHVVEEADEIIVRMADRREFIAQLIGKDERSDVALIKIEAEALPVVKIGSGDQLKVGEWVLAIGSPFGFDHSVTAGIVSAKGRSLPTENYVPFIQTDVAINPGNSGGPLFNLDGEVVGVNSQIYSDSGGYMGLSFAIPIEVAMDVANQLQTTGKVSRGWLGVMIQDVTGELAESFSMDRPRGALIARILPNSPAESAGLQVGDVILEYNGTPLRSSSELPPLVGATNVDQPAELMILREGQEIKRQVDIGELPGDDALVWSGEYSQPKAVENRLGVMVSKLTPEQRKQLSAPTDKGVMVETVTGQAAREAGIEEGDVILMLNNQEITEVSQFNQLVQNLPAGKTVAVLVHRASGPIFLALRTPAK
jgi:serine protease Do